MGKGRRLRRSRLATPDLTPGAVVALLQRVRQGAAALWRANASPLPGLAGCWLAGWHLAGPPSILRDAEHAPHPRSRRLGLSARGQPGTCAYLPTLPPLTHCPSRLTSVSGFDSRALPGLEPTQAPFVAGFAVFPHHAMNKPPYEATGPEKECNSMVP